MFRVLRETFDSDLLVTQRTISLLLSHCNPLINHRSSLLDTYSLPFRNLGFKYSILPSRRETRQRKPCLCRQTKLSPTSIEYAKDQNTIGTKVLEAISQYFQRITCLTYPAKKFICSLSYSYTNLSEFCRLLLRSSSSETLKHRIRKPEPGTGNHKPQTGIDQSKKKFFKYLISILHSFGLLQLRGH